MRNPKNVHYNPTTKQLDQYVTDNLIVDEDTFEPNNYPLVKTADVKLVLDHIRPWLDNQESFMLIGPEGCGKTYDTSIYIYRYIFLSCEYLTVVYV